VRPRDRELAQRIDAELTAFDQTVRALPGVRDVACREAFREQLLESIHRVRFVEIIRGRQISDRRADPNDDLFDPVKAAILHQRSGNVEEAFWLTFLFVHFGRHARGNWRYAREVYGRLGDGRAWDWASTSQDPAGFREWLNAHQNTLKRPGAGFGNHRKRESLDARSETGTGAVVESYVRWVNPPRSHQQLVAEAVARSGSDRQAAFDDLYRSMDAVVRFGRLARFDYLTMVGKLEVAPIDPGSPYLDGSSGPLGGARLLFGCKERAEILDSWVVELDERLRIGMQVLEDALCNWQKSPKVFVPFRG
jgi:Alpha-glutamyl/putrescinyl thymine pyrophosphorylase clade 3